MLVFLFVCQILLLFLFVFVVLLFGIWEVIGLIGKDEFFFGLCMLMEMIEGNYWLVFFFDGVLCICKLLLFYWMGCVSFEVFGILLMMVCMVGVFFVVLLIVLIVGVVCCFFGKVEVGWIVGCILFGCFGMVIEGW